MATSAARLVLGPLLRHVDESSAALWLEVSAPAVVEVDADGVTGSAQTFAVHGHHYALVELEHLDAGTRRSYEVRLDGALVWPEPDSPFPPSVIVTPEADAPLAIAYGSCRTAVPNDAENHSTHGVDAMRSYALRLSGLAAPQGSAEEAEELEHLVWPDLLLLLGDQVYADETSEAMQEFIASRRDLDEPPAEELKDYEEYAHLYSLAWSDPANRWLLSTVPSAMIFDDHDVRDDWNTSHTWRAQMESTPWWHGRIVAALSSYWVYQHLGNMSRDEREQDELWRAVRDHEGPGAPDLGELLDAFADRVDQEPDTYRWSYSRDFGTRVRLVVVDSRAARVLDPEHRAMLDPAELAWLDSRLQGDVDHLLVGTSLPFLLARGLHHAEAFSEALAQGAWGRLGARVGERLRQAVDLEHWAAFQETYLKVADMVIEVATGARGAAPSTVTFLSGDVHHSYVSRARLTRREARRRGPLVSTLVQAVCSPIRNPLPMQMRCATAALAYGVAGPIGRLVAVSAKVPSSPLRWRNAEGPWFDNNIGLLETAGRGLRLRWFTGDVIEEDHERPRLRKIVEHRVR
jgi:phosphodiesterase/alkaline phosphatase D-like protein